MSVDECTHYICRNLLSSDINRDEQRVRALISEFGTVSVYWGIEPTEVYDISVLYMAEKIKDLLYAECVVYILYADTHARLLGKPVYPIDNLQNTLARIGVDNSRVNYILGSTWQYDITYLADMYDLAKHLTYLDVHLATRNLGFENPNMPTMATYMYVAMQCIDEHYAGVDIQIGDFRQMGIFDAAEKYLPVINYKPVIHYTYEFKSNVKFPISNVLEDIYLGVTQYDSISTIQLGRLLGYTDIVYKFDTGQITLDELHIYITDKLFMKICH